MRAQGNLSTTSVQLSNTTPTAGTIDIYITEQGLTSPAGLTSFLSGFTSNLFGGSAFSAVEFSFSAIGGTQLTSHTFNGIGTSDPSNLASDGTLLRDG